MKYGLLSLFLTLLFYGCGVDRERSGKEGKARVSLQGKVINGGQVREVHLWARQYPYAYADTLLSSVLLDEQGRFKMSFEMEREAYVLFTYGRQRFRMFLMPGDSIFMEFRSDSAEGLRLEGKGAEQNRFLEEKRALIKRLDHAHTFGLNMDTAAFDTIIDRKYERIKSFQENYFKEHENIHALFRELERKRSRFLWVRRKLSYPEIHRYRSKQGTNEFSAEYWRFLEAVELNDTLGLMVPGFLKVAYRIADRSAFQEGSAKVYEGELPYRQHLFHTIDKKFNGVVRDAVLTYAMIQEVEAGHLEQGSDLFDLYKKTLKDTGHLKRLKERL